MSETGIGTNLYVRGIGSGINQGFEQSVGLYIDGVYYGRAQLTRAPFMDMAQAEALRGPQAILLGNNSIAGALNFTTAKPSDTCSPPSARLYEPDHNEQEMNGMISGPLGEPVRRLDWGARFAGRYRTMDGYIDNTHPATGTNRTGKKPAPASRSPSGRDRRRHPEVRDQQFRRRRAGRSRSSGPTLPIARGSSQTGFSNNTGSSASGAREQLPGIPRRILRRAPADDRPGTFDPATDYVFDNPGLRDGTLNYDRQSNGDKSDNDITSIVGTLNSRSGEHTLTATLTATSSMTTRRTATATSPAPQFILNSKEEYSQDSMELRLTSPQDGRLRYLDGPLLPGRRTRFRRPDLPARRQRRGAAGRLRHHGQPRRRLRLPGRHVGVPGFRAEHLQQLHLRPGGLRPHRPLARQRRTSATATSRRRPSRILRQGDLERNPFNLNDANDFDRLSAGAVLFASIFDVSFHQLRVADQRTTPPWELVTDFDLTDDILLYGSVKTGFKSGGFDVRSNSEPAPVGSTALARCTPPTWRTRSTRWCPRAPSSSRTSRPRPSRRGPRSPC